MDQPPNGVREQLRELRAEVKALEKDMLDRHHRLRSDMATMPLLVDGLRRTELTFAELERNMSAVERDCANAKERLDNHRDRLKELEGLNVAVLADRLKRFQDDAAQEMSSVKRLLFWVLTTFVTFILTMLGGIVLFVVTQAAQ